MEWFEELPEQCPPENALEPNNEMFFRVINGDDVDVSDFLSQREVYGKDKVFKGKEITECITRAVSVFKNLQDANNLLKFPKFRNKKIAKVTLRKNDGLLLKTLSTSHYSWWRSKDFNINSACLYKDE
ncbi:MULTISPECIES: hypothetical protein [unclassified Dysgonomonas]|uniref:hypothetical protein n=1 Tax=unclassified Dysgonomonas TaxID=2630389 RepID=UPI002474FAF8|nr:MULTISPECIES: hypothetical protein [unclassified Dysgonomonas]